MAASSAAGRSPTRADDVYAAIRADIVSLKLPPGAMVQEQALAEQLGVSRTPIREALRRLGQEGLVQTVPKKGTLVSGVSVNDIREVFQVRLALEPLAARLAASIIPRDVVEHLLDEHLPPGDTARGIQPGYQDLHSTIRHYCGNSRLESILEMLTLDNNRILALGNLSHLRQSLEHHLDILAALKARDGAAAEEAMRRHIAVSQQILVSALMSSD